MSRHHRTGERSSTSRRPAAVSTSVPTWGCSACTSPSPAQSSSSASSMPTMWSHWAATARSEGPTRRRPRRSTRTSWRPPPRTARRPRVPRRSSRRAASGRAARAARTRRSADAVALERGAEGIGFARAGSRGRRARPHAMPSDAISAEDPVGIQHDPPSGHLAHAPRDRPGTDPFGGPRRARTSSALERSEADRVGALHNAPFHTHRAPLSSIRARMLERSIARSLGRGGSLALKEGER